MKLNQHFQTLSVGDDVMDVNKDLEKAISELDRIGEKPNYINGGEYNDRIEYQMTRDYIFNTFLKAFRDGMRLS